MPLPTVHALSDDEAAGAVKRGCEEACSEAPSGSCDVGSAPKRALRSGKVEDEALQRARAKVMRLVRQACNCSRRLCLQQFESNAFEIMQMRANLQCLDKRDSDQAAASSACFTAVPQGCVLQ